MSIDKIFEEYNPNGVFHLAAQTSGRLSEVDSEKDINSNVVGSLNFCEWAKLKKPKRVVFTSSMSVYGNIAKNAKEI